MVGKNYAADVWNYDVYKDMKKFEKPVLILHGDKDDVVDFSYSKRAAKSYPNVEFHIISGGSHVFHGEHFSQTVDYILNYLRDLRFFK